MLRVTLAAWDQQPQALGGEAHVLARDGDQFAPPQRPGIAEQQQGVGLREGSGKNLGRYAASWIAF